LTNRVVSLTKLADQCQIADMLRKGPVNIFFVHANAGGHHIRLIGQLKFLMISSSISFDHQNKKTMKRLFSLPSIGLIAAFLLGYKLCPAQTLFTVEVTGKGKPMILIHGLYCSKDVWMETVDHYKSSYECHVVTVAGFGGNPPVSRDNFLEAVKDDVIAYVKEKKLNKPVLLGHSMGAFLSYWAAASAPGLFEKVIAVDGAPFLSALQMPGATPESSKPMATMMRDRMAGQTPEQTLESQKAFLPTMISNQDRIDQVAAIAMKSDGKTQGQVIYELFTIDLRQAVASIDCPVLVMGAWIAYKNYGVNHDILLQAYTQQLSAVKNARVEITDNARHFIFYDDPAWFFEKADAFLEVKKSKR
jgi:pimeloyl-ACP methyl ester carboxylesterase